MLYRGAEWYGFTEQAGAGCTSPPPAVLDESVPFAVASIALRFPTAAAPIPEFSVS